MVFRVNSRSHAGPMDAGGAWIFAGDSPHQSDDPGAPGMPGYAQPAISGMLPKASAIGNKTCPLMQSFAQAMVRSLPCWLVWNMTFSYFFRVYIYIYILGIIIIPIEYIFRGLISIFPYIGNYMELSSIYFSGG